VPQHWRDILEGHLGRVDELATEIIQIVEVTEDLVTVRRDAEPDSERGWCGSWAAPRIGPAEERGDRLVHECVYGSASQALSAVQRWGWSARTHPDGHLLS